MSVDVDVVVVGAGAAGLAAALRAAESGLEVALLERTEHFRTGNNTSMSTSMIPAGGSRWQAAAGIEDSPAAFAADVMRKTHGTADPVLTTALTDVAPDLVAWLADSCELDLDLVTDFNYPGHASLRCHSIPTRAGRDLLRGLLLQVDARENITLAVPMTLAEVMADRSGVHGVVVRSGGGSSEEITSHAVVLASGGYGANHELIARLIPEIAAATYHGGDGCQGDAMRVAETLGADIGYLDAYQGHGSLAIPQAILMTWAGVMHGGVVLNAEGRRFADETQGYSEFAALVIAEPGGVAYYVIDEEIHQRCLTFQDYRDLLDNHGVHFVDDADALAAAIGAEPAVVADELAQARAVASAAGSDRVGRTYFPHALEAPYAYVKITGALFHTQGGVLVSPEARVLRGGEPIPGLYAAGGAAAGISGRGASGYLAGNGLLAALGLGYLAGTDLANRERA